MRGLTVRWHDPEASVVEGIASRGDRRVGPVIERVWRAGGTFQEWSERFDLGLWEAAMDAEGLAISEAVHRTRDRARGPALGPHLRRAPPGLLVAGLAGRAGRGRARGLPVDAVLRLWRVHGVRLEHVVASAVPPPAGSQGTGQDLATGGSVPVRFIGVGR